MPVHDFKVDTILLDSSSMPQIQNVAEIGGNGLTESQWYHINH